MVRVGGGDQGGGGYVCVGGGGCGWGGGQGRCVWSVGGGGGQGRCVWSGVWSVVNCPELKGGRNLGNCWQ